MKNPSAFLALIFCVLTAGCLILTGCPSGIGPDDPPLEEVQEPVSLTFTLPAAEDGLHAMLYCFTEDEQAGLVPCSDTVRGPSGYEMLYDPELHQFSAEILPSSGSPIIAAVDVIDEQGTVHYYGSAAVTAQSPVTVCEPMPGYSIGDSGPDDGCIYYDAELTGYLVSGFRYIEVADVRWGGSDADPTASWSAIETGELLTGEGIGDGRLNTVAIAAAAVASESSQGFSASAFGLCLGCQGSCWYLPSEAELTALQQSGVSCSCQPDKYYWTSTQADTSHAMCVNVGGDREPVPVFNVLEGLVCVRPIRYL